MIVKALFKLPKTLKMSKVPGIAEGILSFNRRIGFPTTLAEMREHRPGGNRKNNTGR